LPILSQGLQFPIADHCLVDQARERRVIEKRFYPEMN
jgi:hypothetical protein